MAMLARLHDPLIMGDDYQRRLLLSKVLVGATEGRDVTHLVPSMVKLLAHPDLCVKKLAGEVLSQLHRDQGEVLLLAINTLVQHTHDSNPMIRGLALRTLSSLQHDSATEHLERVVPAALSDRSAQVRRVAVLSCAQLHRRSPGAGAVRDAGLIDVLYGMIRDPDPTVMVNCLAALEEILSEEGGVVVNAAIAHHLLRKLSSLPTWCQIQVLHVLMKYDPPTESEVLDVMNAADFCLEQNSAALVTACLDLFCHLLRLLPHLFAEVFRRSRASLVSHLSLGNAELIFFIVDVVLSAPAEALAHFRPDVQTFFCRNKDPLYLKLKKISVIPLLVSEATGPAVLDELGLYCVGGCPAVSLHALRALGKLHQQHPRMAAACRDAFRRLADSHTPLVLSNLLTVLQDMDVPGREFWESLLSPLCHRFGSIATAADDRGKAAFLFLLGEHLRDCEDSVSVIEGCVEEFSEISNRQVKVNLLDAAAKMFLSHPFELQSLLGGLLELALKDSDLDVKARGYFLYCLLQKGADAAKAVLLEVPGECL